MKRAASFLTKSAVASNNLELNLDNIEFVANTVTKRKRLGDSGLSLGAGGLATPGTSEDAQASSGPDSEPPSKKQRARTSAIELYPDSDTEEAETYPPSRKQNKCLEVSDAEATVAVTKALRPTLIGPAFPQSAYSRCDDAHTRREITQERVALRALLSAFDRQYEDRPDSRPEFVAFTLDQFSIYRPEDSYSGRRAKELVTLNRLRQDGYPTFCFEGFLSFGGERYYVENVPFRTLSIDGYGDSNLATADNQVYIQSFQGAHHDIWLYLQNPAPEYLRFYKPFKWIATFSKYCVEYLLDHEKVTLSDFRRRFVLWLRTTYGEQSATQAWLAEANTQDFRNRVATDIVFLYNECWNIEHTLCRNPVFGEVDFGRLRAIPKQPNCGRSTVVTPFVNECFERMYFGDKLSQRDVTEDVADMIDRRKARLGMTPRHALSAARQTVFRVPQALETDQPTRVSPGDVVLVREDPRSNWGVGPWYAYVQQVRVIKDKETTVLDIIWLYTAQNTTMAKASYHFPNELFFSDHCECGKDALDLDCIIGVVKVSWFVENPLSVDGLFVRQKFRTVHQEDAYDFVSLKQNDFYCRCDHRLSDFDHCLSKYTIGDTVLVRQRQSQSDDCLEPAVLIAFNDVEQKVTLRRMLLKSKIDNTARPNEAVLTQDTYQMRPDKVVRKCHVRFFASTDISQGNIPTPYDRHGTGDFFVTHEGQGDSIHFPPLIEGWDPSQEPVKEKLIGMGIFCGGGTFDRGLEEGGAVKFRYAADWAEHALHSYRANLDDPKETEFFLGSVNDLLARAMDGSSDGCVPLPGDIQVLSAGSPCPGFSQMQRNKYSDDATQMASMVASVVAFVDFYVPEHLIFENVVTMTAPMGIHKDQYVFSQIVAALVAMGYQVSQFLMDSWSVGSSQQRSRLFIVASAPGLRPLKQPPRTHGHPDVLAFRERSLGTSANGLKFARRRDDYTTFDCRTAADGSKDLPNIGDSQVQLCIPFPDHRTATDETAINRTRMAVIPKRPYGMSLVKAYNAGVLRGEPLDWYNSFVFKGNRIRSDKNSKTYGRVFPDRLFPTILTKFAIGDGMNGRSLHWNQDRILTIQEARRAQGYPDHEILVGNASQRLKIVGNSVDRSVALVLGLALRDSWVNSQYSPPVRHRRKAKGLAALESEPAEISVPGLSSRSESVTADGNAPPASFSARSESGSNASAGHSNNEMGPEESPLPAQLDNKTVKMSLILTEDEIVSLRKGGSSQIIKMLQSRDEHQAARQSLQDMRDRSK